MKPTYLAAVALGLTPIGLVLWGSGGFAQTAAEPTVAPEAAASSYTIGSAAAVVDGVTLTLGELIAIRRDLPDQYQNLADQVLLDGLVEQLIGQMLLAQAATAAGLEQNPVVAMTLLIQERAVLADAYLRQAVKTRATPEAVEALYRQAYLDAAPIDEVRAGHILVETEEQANALKAQLDAGADFAVLAGEHSTDTGNAGKGGDLGWFVKPDMVPAFADAAFALEPGTISAPVKTNFGWHLIKLDERRERQPPALEEVRDTLLDEVVQQARIDTLDELRMQSVITMPEPPLPPQSIRDDTLLDAAK